MHQDDYGRGAPRAILARLLEQASTHLSWAVRQWQARRTIAALEMLSDDSLRDIGVERHEIPVLALRVTAPGKAEARALKTRSAKVRKEVSV